MSEDERLQLAGDVSEAHAVIRETALRLRRELPPKAPALKAAVRAEESAFRLKRELQRMELEAPAQKRQPLPEVRRGGKVVDLERLRRGKYPNEET